MTPPDVDPQQPICIFCLTKVDRRTGAVYTNCDLCIGRGGLRWCECACGWLRDDMRRLRLTQPEGEP